MTTTISQQQFSFPSHSNMASLAQYISGVCFSSKKTMSNTSCVILGQSAAIAGHFSHNSKPTISQSVASKSRTLIRDHKQDHGRVSCTDDGSCVAPLPAPPSTLDLAKDFYDALNHKNTDKLEKVMTDNCQFCDLIFYTPFDGRQDVMQFLRELMDAMGPNVRFFLESATEGDNLTASVIWHLEWNDMEIPFTKGCSFFSCEEFGKTLLIRKITGVEELPIKPGELVLKLLKTTASFFDQFPAAARGLLENSQGHGGLLKLLDILGAYRKHSSSET